MTKRGEEEGKGEGAENRVLSTNSSSDFLVMEIETIELPMAMNHHEYPLSSITSVFTCKTGLAWLACSHALCIYNLYILYMHEYCIVHCDFNDSLDFHIVR